MVFGTWCKFLFTNRRKLAPRDPSFHLSQNVGIRFSAIYVQDPYTLRFTRLSYSCLGAIVCLYWNPKRPRKRNPDSAAKTCASKSGISRLSEVEQATCVVALTMSQVFKFRKLPYQSTFTKGLSTSMLHT